MIDKRVTLPSEIKTNEYRSWFRCTNCGVIFQYDLAKGTLVSSMKGSCPNCGVKSGTPQSGVFKVVKYKPKYDDIQRHYYK